MLNQDERRGHLAHDIGEKAPVWCAIPLTSQIDIPARPKEAWAKDWRWRANLQTLARNDYRNRHDLAV